jgi:hypothetical protein
MKKIRHRDTVALSVLSAAFLLAGEIANQDIAGIYATYLRGHLGEPLIFSVNLLLVILAFTTYFGGILVLLGGIHFSWGRIDRGRFLVSLGVGISLLGLLKGLALGFLLAGTPAPVVGAFTTSLTGVGLLLGVASHTLMGRYALMIKKHARTILRRWRRARRPMRRSVRS